MGAAPEHVASYWVVPDRVLAGEYPARPASPQAEARLDSLLGTGISAFFDLTEPDELPSYLPLLKQRASLRGIRIRYRRFPIPDFGLPDRNTMLAVLDSIDGVIARGATVYVHCMGGLGRTGMVVGCYLIRRGLSAEAALDQIADSWQKALRSLSVPLSPETPEQIKFVQDWHE